MIWHTGDVIRKLRDVRDIRQDDLAQRAKVDRGTLIDMEKGREGTRRTLNKVIGALGVSMASVELAVPVSVSADVRAVLEKVDRLPVATRAAFLVTMQAAIDKALAKHADV